MSALPARKTERSLDEKFEAKAAAWQRNSELLATTHRLVRGDARNLTEHVGGAPVHLVVTSPPYWDLKEYGDDYQGAQLGHIEERERFLDELDAVWRQCFELLAPGGRLCIVVGDVCRSRRSHGRHVVEPLHAYLQVRCQRLGFDPLAPIIWNKIANMTTEMGGAGAFLGKPYEPNAIIKYDIEYVLMFRKPGGYRKPTQEQRDLSLIEKDDYQRWFRQIWSDIPGEVQRGHPAPFPAELARRLIGMFSFVGDTVIDPFVGTGTTIAAAMEMHRNSIGVELDQQYAKMASTRISAPAFGAQVTVEGLPG